MAYKNETVKLKEGVGSSHELNRDLFCYEGSESPHKTWIAGDKKGCGQESSAKPEQF